MLVTLSACSILYALFFMIIAFYNIDINRIENVISLNIQEIQDNKPDLDSEEV
jgi:hypothetical protein